MSCQLCTNLKKRKTNLCICRQNWLRNWWPSSFSHSVVPQIQKTGLLTKMPISVKKDSTLWANVSFHPPPSPPPRKVRWCQLTSRFLDAVFYKYWYVSSRTSVTSKTARDVFIQWQIPNTKLWNRVLRILRFFRSKIRHRQDRRVHTF